MDTWKTLYLWELKKIVKKRFAVISLAAVYLFIVVGLAVSFTGDVTIEGIKYMSERDYLKLSRANALALSGSEIDDELISKTVEAEEEHVLLTESFGGTATEAQRKQIADAYVQKFMPYMAIYEYIRKITGFSEYEIRMTHPNQEMIYAQELKNLKTVLEDFFLTDAEKAYWMKAYQRLPKPAVFQYANAYSNLIAMIYAMSALLIMLIGVSLSGVFSEDRAYRSDALVLSSKKGRGALYSAKIAAGVTFAELSTVGLCILSAMIVFAQYGIEGFSAPLQVYKPFYPYDISIGQFSLIAFGLILVVMFFMSLFTMFLSACFSRPIIPMSLVTACVVMGMFINVSASHRLISQIWDWLPTNYLFVSKMFDLRLFPLFGRLFLSWQVLPWIYILAGGLIIFCGFHKYKSQQVGNR